MADELDKIATSWLGRSFQAGKMASGILGSVAAAGVKSLLTPDDEKKAAAKRKSQVDRAIKTVLQLGNMKGGLMKLGQMASYVDTIIPDEVREVMTSLQDKTPPMKPAQVDKIVEQELGKKPDQIFKEWEPNAFSAASIGQVHRAKLPDGTAVAVKVQYPGIETAFESDLKNATMMGQISRMFFQAVDMDELVDELKERLMEECDYRLERQNQQDFIDLFDGHKDMIFPEVYSEFSAKRVLTSEYIDGKRFSDYIKECSQTEKNRIGKIIFTMVMTSIFKHAIFNGDPHPGNYLVMGKKIAFLDFGCVKRWSPEFIGHWRRLIRAGYEDDLPAFTEGFIDLGFTKKPNEFDFVGQFALNKIIWRPFLTKGDFTFTREHSKELSEKLIYNNSNFFKTNLPRDFVIINRLQWGMMSILADMEATFNAQDIMHPMVYSD